MTSAKTVPPLRSLTTMQPFFRELAVNRETALALLSGLGPEQLAWRPSRQEWSLAEICGHVAAVTTLYLPALDDAISVGHANAAYSDRPFLGSTASRVLVWSLEPPVRVRLRSPSRLLPDPRQPAEEARADYRAAQLALELRLERAAGLDLAHVRVRPPMLGRVRFALGTTFAVLLAHERRHLWQATTVRQHPAFPEGR